jgi:hypothetical protein
LGYLAIDLYTSLSFIHWGIIVAKGQQKSNKETKKPKKDTSTPKPASGLSEPVRATVVNTVYTKLKQKDR